MHYKYAYNALKKIDLMYCNYGNCNKLWSLSHYNMLMIIALKHYVHLRVLIIRIIQCNKQIITHKCVAKNVFNSWNIGLHLSVDNVIYCKVQAWATNSSRQCVHHDCMRDVDYVFQEEMMQ